MTMIDQAALLRRKLSVSDSNQEKPFTWDPFLPAELVLIFSLPAVLWRKINLTAFQLK